MTKLHEIRAMMSMNGAEVARRIGISKQALYNYEKGLRDVPPAVLLKLSKLYGVSIEALLGEKESAPADNSRGAVVERISRLSDDDLQRMLEFLEFLENLERAQAAGLAAGYEAGLSQIKNAVIDPNTNFLDALNALPKNEGEYLASLFAQVLSDRTDRKPDQRLPEKSKSLKAE